MKSFESFSSHGCINPIIATNSSTTSRNSGSTVLRTNMKLYQQVSDRKRTLTSRPRVPKQRYIPRTMSLPTKLEQAPRTKKLFWFRPNVSYLKEEEKETRKRQQQRAVALQVQRARRDFIPSNASSENDSDRDDSTDAGDFMDDLLGLRILADE
jgi:hypothetical protein